MIDLSRRRIEPRVGQIDASILDSELLNMLKNQLWAAFKTYRPELKDKYESEFVLLLKLALFKLTVWDHSATYGAKLQNLKFVDSRSRTGASISVAQKIGYGMMVVGGSYFWEKLEEYLANASYNRQDDPRVDRVRRITDTLSTVWSASSLANFILFLFSGKYSTLILRMLRIRLSPTSRQVNRQVNFEFQNRQLVWNAFTEFLLFILPLLNLPKLKRSAVRLMTGAPKSNSTEDGQGELAFLPRKTCAICYKQDAQNDNITNPYKLDCCDDVYCYICIAGMLAENEPDGWNCIRCGRLAKSAQPFVDVDPAAVKFSLGSNEEESGGAVVNEKTQLSQLSEKKSRGDQLNQEPGSDSESDFDDDDDDTPQQNFIVRDDY